MPKYTGFVVVWKRKPGETWIWEGRLNKKDPEKVGFDALRYTAGAFSMLIKDMEFGEIFHEIVETGLFYWADENPVEYYAYLEQGLNRSLPMISDFSILKGIIRIAKKRLLKKVFLPRKTKR